MDKALTIMTERFGKDSLIALATMDGDRPSVRTVDAVYENGSFYTITHALSGKMNQIRNNPHVGICGEWFTGHGIAENLGHVLTCENADILQKLRNAFSAWYNNGHICEEDTNTCILRITLTDGVLFADGVRYDITF